MSRQHFDWGTIDWVVEPEEGKNGVMRAGFNVMYPHTTQQPHIHYGDEQIMYFLSGYGYQRVGSKLEPIYPGVVCHISAGSVHETINERDEPIVKFFVSIPVYTVQSTADGAFRNRILQGTKEVNAEFLKDAVHQMYPTLIAPLRLPVAIFDSKNNLIFRNSDYPQYCVGQCGVNVDLYRCQLYGDKKTTPYYADPTALVCHNGISLYTIPITTPDRYILGFIRAGHIRESHDLVGAESPVGDAPYDVPRSTVSGILQVMEHLASSISHHYELFLMHDEILQSKEIISGQDASLHNTRNKAFNYQINQHFLFNTLNMIVGMAASENAPGTGAAVGELSQLFRYTLRTSEYFVPLHDEIEHLMCYLGLQQKRFEGRLRVDCDLPEALMKTSVPFNFMQPIAENAFVHGFSELSGQMRLAIRAERNKAYLRLLLEDNGKGMSPETLTALRERIAAGVGGGISMVSQKLSSLYGDNYRLEIESGEKGTRVVLDLPVLSEEGV